MPRARALVEILSARRNDAQKDWERKTEKGAQKNNYSLQYNSSGFVLLKRVVKQLHTSAQIGFLKHISDSYLLFAELRVAVETTHRRHHHGFVVVRVTLEHPLCKLI